MSFKSIIILSGEESMLIKITRGRKITCNNQIYDKKMSKGITDINCAQFGT